MRLVEWKDSDGYMRRRWLKDGDPDEMGMQGIPDELPDMNALDWDNIRRNLHNQLMARGLYSFQDVQRSQNGVTAAIRSAVVKPLLALYRQQERATRQEE